jgi:uncharacterized LabA/DUF88 family protein
MGRAIAYVDGLNLYYAIREMEWRRYLWLNLPALARDVLASRGSTDELVATKYFTSPMLNEPDRAKRQALYIDALRAEPGLVVFPGNIKPFTRWCPHCRKPIPSFHEKQTDTGMTAEIVADAIRDRFDTAILVTRDTDFVPAVRSVRSECPGKRLILVRPPGGAGWADLKIHCDEVVKLRSKMLARCQFPDVVVAPGGVLLRRPPEFS